MTYLGNLDLAQIRHYNTLAAIVKPVNNHNRDCTSTLDDKVALFLSQNNIIPSRALPAGYYPVSRGKALSGYMHLIQLQEGSMPAIRLQSDPDPKVVDNGDSTETRENDDGTFTVTYPNGGTEEVEIEDIPPNGSRN